MAWSPPALKRRKWFVEQTRDYATNLFPPPPLRHLLGRLEQQLAEHRVSLTHLDATLRLFDPNLLLPDADPQQRERVSWFRPGECLRAIYDVLREAPQPLTTRDVARRVIAAKDMTVTDERTQALIQKTILASLSRAKSTIERLEVNGVVSWRVCQAA